MPPSSAERFVSLPRGLRVRVAVAAGMEPLVAVVRAIAEDRLTLGVLDLPSDAEALKGLHTSIAAQLHGRMYELDASILDIETTPPALVLTLPVEARRAQRRELYRLNVSLDARGSWREPDDEAEDEADEPVRVHELTGARLLDISGGGALLRVRERVPVGAVLSIQFTLEPGTSPLDVVARAKDSREEPRTHAYRINTEFEGIARRTQELIVRFIFQQQSLLSRRRSA